MFFAMMIYPSDEHNLDVIFNKYVTCGWQNSLKCDWKACELNRNNANASSSSRILLCSFVVSPPKMAKHIFSYNAHDLHRISAQCSYFGLGHIFRFFQRDAILWWPSEPRWPHASLFVYDWVSSWLDQSFTEVETQWTRTKFSLVLSIVDFIQKTDVFLDCDFLLRAYKCRSFSIEGHCILMLKESHE